MLRLKMSDDQIVNELRDTYGVEFTAADVKGYNKLDPKENEGQLQSSMKEWEESVKKYRQ